ncbi:MAG: hypothetical protein KatS3mg102_1080 [Planctomycetota bacterium]|nr:MAG: hypothetical protein KatS3mg102_1080 [Planctomycetota bacterium]
MRARAPARASFAGQPAGFTMIELIVVLAVMALALSFVVTRIDHLIPGEGLKASAREIASTIELARAGAASQGRIRAIRYDLEAGSWRLFAPLLDEYGQEVPGPGPWGLHPAGPAQWLHEGVRFVAIQPMGLDLQRGGELAVRFDPLAIEGSHIVYLENRDGERFSIKYNALTGLAEAVEGEAVFEGSEG